MNRDCPAGSTCFVTGDGAGACSLAVDLSCGTGTGTECATGLTCIGGQCVRTCTMASECPSDGECRNVPGTSISFCFDMRVPAPDAGVPDDVGMDAPQSVDAGSDGGSDANVDGGHDAGFTTTTPPPREVCIGGGFICAITGAAREVHCWGDAKRGALGPGSSVDCTLLVNPSDMQITSTPVYITGGPMTGADGVACGAEFACAHLDTGEVRCWGANDVGQLARPAGTSSCSSSAVLVSFGGSIDLSARVFAMGSEACLFEPSTGTIRCWGLDRGIVRPGGGSIATPTIVAAPGDAGVARLAALAPGSDFACAITQYGDPFCWGQSALGETGMGTRTPPPSWLRVMTAGRDHVVAIHGSDDVLSWGSDRYHQLLEPPDGSIVDCGGTPCSPSYVGPAPDHFMVVASQGDARHTCAIVDAAGHVDCWGENRTSQSGVPNTGDAGTDGIGVHVRDATGELMGITEVFVGGENGCARNAARQLWCWGANDRSQLQTMATGPEDARDVARRMTP